jgi:hypothetical protein
MISLSAQRWQSEQVSHVQADVAFQAEGVREGKPLGTAATVLYLIENILLLGTIGEAIFWPVG